MRTRATGVYAAALLGLALAGCDAGACSSPGPSDSGAAALQALTGAHGLAVDPANGALFVAASHRKGRAKSLRLVAVRWGRRVDVYDFDDASGARTLRLRDVLIGEELGAAATECDPSASLVHNWPLGSFYYTCQYNTER